MDARANRRVSRGVRAQSLRQPGFGLRDRVQTSILFGLCGFRLLLELSNQPIDSMPMPRAALGTESLHTLRLGERIIHLRGRVFTEWVIDRVLGLY